MISNWRTDTAALKKQAHVCFAGFGRLKYKTPHLTEWRVASWPISRVLSSTVIYLGVLSPKRSSSLPRRHVGHMIMRLYLALLRTGFSLPRLLPAARCALTTPFHPYQQLQAIVGGIFSVALSVDSRLPEVIWRSALWSPDFPLPTSDSDCIASSRRVVWSIKHINSSNFSNCRLLP